MKNEKRPIGWIEKIGIKNIGKLNKNQLTKCPANFTFTEFKNIYAAIITRLQENILTLKKHPVILRGKGHGICSFTPKGLWERYFLS